MTETYSLRSLAPLLGATLVQDSPAAAAPLLHYVYDTRLLAQPLDSVFLALRGDLRDGHTFVLDAYQRGVRCFWVSQPVSLPPDAAVLHSPDVLASLQLLAAHHRNQFTGPVVGITGSNGKTTVKEWLATVLEPHHEVYKSPGSYNSQLGVALALLGLRAHHTIALLEAGISQRGEMARLAQLIRPTLGVLTHMGDAHAEGFSSFEEKLAEKLQLFATCQTVVACGSDATVREALRYSRLNTQLVASADVYPIAPVRYAEVSAEPYRMLLSLGTAALHVPVPQPGEAARENLALVFAVADTLGISHTDIAAAATLLQPVSMRLEMVTDNPEITVLNDAYNADAESVRAAFSLLAGQAMHPRRRVILSDLEHQGSAASSIQQALLQLAIERFGPDAIETVGPRYQQLAQTGVRAYADTAELLAAFDYARYRDATVLLKGARRFHLEQIIPLLTHHPGATYFKINLNALRHNYLTIRNWLPPGTRVLVMLKAAAYGGGSWQIAQELERLGVEGYAVAQPIEGIELRRRGIRGPILVMGPDPAHLDQLVAYDLAPAIWSFALLQQWGQLAAAETAKSRTVRGLHLEFDTGMARLGFTPAEMPRLLQWLREHPAVPVAGIFTHLAASEDPAADAFTQQQINTFTPLAAALKALYPNALAHALNTGGILRHPQHAFDMVRLGIGLYGVAPTDTNPLGLQEIGSLHTAIAQVHHYAAGTTVSYNRTETLARDSRIGTLPLGYADGLHRALGNRRLSVLVRGQLAPVVGRICMDLMMIDLTDIPDAQEGDEVVIFGNQGTAHQSVQALGTAAGTIAYEILAGIAPRVRRVYVKE